MIRDINGRILCHKKALYLFTLKVRNSFKSQIYKSVNLAGLEDMNMRIFVSDVTGLPYGPVMHVRELVKSYLDEKQTSISCRAMI